MIQKLRMKFIALSIGIVAAVVFVIIFGINLLNYTRVTNRADNILEVLAENDGYFPELLQHMSPEVRYTTRFFSVTTDISGNPVKVDTVNIASKTRKEVLEYYKKVLKGNKNKGFIDNYRYKVEETPTGALLVFIDCSQDLEIYNSFLKASVIISTAGIGTIFAIIVLLSKRMIAPVAESYEKQKQFITDAGHELKTPLTIINTNTDVLEMEHGESEWTKNIHSQVSRLSELVTGLISLSRMDEEHTDIINNEFSISETARETVDSFRAVAEVGGKKMVTSIEEDIIFHGDEKSITQLFSIIIDNSIKYSPADTDINFSMKRESRRIVIELKNISSDIKKGDLSYVFERFYRGDKSRSSETSGYGIGLSLARAIVLKHKGEINAISPDGKEFIIRIVL